MRSEYRHRHGGMVNCQFAPIDGGKRKSIDAPGVVVVMVVKSAASTSGKQRGNRSTCQRSFIVSNTSSQLSMNNFVQKCKDFHSNNNSAFTFY